MKKRVVVTGMGVITPIGLNVEEFWNNLSRGVSGVDYIRTFDTNGYPTRIGAEIKDFQPKDYLTSKEQRRMDTFAQYAVAAAEEAIKQAALNMSEIDPFNVGVLVGSGTGGTRMLLENYQKMVDKGPRRVSPFFASGHLVNSSSSEIAIRLGAKGKSGAFVTACATSSSCIGEAFRTIQNGEAEIMIAGGTEGAFTEIDLASFSKIKALSTYNDNPQKACRPFDKNRDGFVLGSGGGIVVLESVESSQRRGVKALAELVGYGTTTDAYHITSPDVDGQAATVAIKRALNDADTSPEAIDYVNAHGTGTKLNDYIETLVIKKVFGSKANDIPVSSNKSMMGHLLGGAGAVEFIASILSIRHSLITPTINFLSRDDGMDLNYVPNKAQKNDVKKVLSNSFGFGGHNSCLILKNWNEGSL